MNWSRVLFRAWVFVTVLWIGFCGNRLVADWPVLGQFVVVIDLAGSHNSDYFARTTVPPDELAQLREEAATRHKQIVQAHVLRTAMQAILQPTASLASGVIVFWIARRIRKS
jgi:hypothetical protein